MEPGEKMRKLEEEVRKLEEERQRLDMRHTKIEYKRVSLKLEDEMLKLKEERKRLDMDHAKIATEHAKLHLERKILEETRAELQRHERMVSILSEMAEAKVGKSEIVGSMLMLLQHPMIRDHMSRTIPACVVCLDKSSECAFDCHHMCMCFDCSRRLTKCPQCRYEGAPHKVYM